MEKLLSYSWHENVRELRNAIEYAYVLCSGSRIESENQGVSRVTVWKRMKKYGINAQK